MKDGSEARNLLPAGHIEGSTPGMAPAWSEVGCNHKLEERQVTE
jgi:hypothetical protein